MIALYATWVRAYFLKDAGWTVWGAVQSSVVGVPVLAVPIRPRPYGNATPTVSPRGGAQFPKTVNGAGANAPLMNNREYVEPRGKNGGIVVGRVASPTPMSSAWASTAWIESSTWRYRALNVVASVSRVGSFANAAFTWA